jgi:hypothetical protein
MRPDQSWTTTSATRDMERELERLSSHAVVVWLSCDRPDISLDRVERAFCSRFRVRPVDITVSRSPPTDFLVTFAHRHHRDAAVAARDFPLGNLDFRIRPWQLITLGERHDLSFHVRLCLEGIPPHAWNESITKRAVARACVLDYVEDDCLSSTKKDARCLNLWVWTENPSDIPKVIWLTITGSVMVIHEGVPPQWANVASLSGCLSTSTWWRGRRTAMGFLPLAPSPGAMVSSTGSASDVTDTISPRQTSATTVDIGTGMMKTKEMNGVGVDSIMGRAGALVSFAASPVRREARTVLIRGASNTATEDPGMEDDTTTLDSVLRPSLWRRGTCGAIAENDIHIAT